MRDSKGPAARARVYLVTGIVTAAALVAMIGVNQYTNRSTEQTPLAQQEEAYDKSGFDDYTALYQEEAAEAAMAQRTEKQEEADTTDAASVSETDTITVENIESSATIDVKPEAAPQPSFDADAGIAWPVQGNVLMNYSMDKTTYFATLDQYKYNPAIIIQAAVNDKVIAGVAGKINDIETNENTGLTVTVDLGDGYQAIYGQLKEVKKGVGDTLEAETVVGYIAEPTKYYSVEGSNLYFAMTKDGKPVNPMEYLK